MFVDRFKAIVGGRVAGNFGELWQKKDDYSERIRSFECSQLSAVSTLVMLTWRVLDQRKRPCGNSGQTFHGLKFVTGVCVAFQKLISWCTQNTRITD